MAREAQGNQCRRAEEPDGRCRIPEIHRQVTMAYAALTPDDRKAMLAELRLASIGALFKDIPVKARLRSPLGIPEGLSEREVSTLLWGIAGTNRLPRLSFLGAGAYRHYIPA